MRKPNNKKKHFFFGKVYIQQTNLYSFCISSNLYVLVYKEIIKFSFSDFDQTWIFDQLYKKFELCNTKLKLIYILDKLFYQIYQAHIVYTFKNFIFITKKKNNKRINLSQTEIYINFSVNQLFEF